MPQMFGRQGGIDGKWEENRENQTITIVERTPNDRMTKPKR